MKMLTWVAAAGAALALGAVAAPAMAKTPCEELTSLKLPHVTITDAKEVAAVLMPASMSPAHPAYCKVMGTSKPTADSDIRFAVLLPEGDAWNGRYLQVGNGGFAGSIIMGLLVPAVSQGYVVAGTDDGHQSTIGTDASWAMNHPEKQIDFGYRALKETTVAAKAILAAYEGKMARFSYFQGCSDGGREALVEAQRYPDDFNGIIAGDPANHWTHLLTMAAWSVQALSATPDSFVPPATLKAVQAEAIRQCGDETGVIENPLACHFNLAAIRCKAAAATDCLTDPQIAALGKIYGGARNPRTGALIMSGYSPGSEGEAGGWVAWITGPSADSNAALSKGFGSNFFRYIVFSDPNYDIRKLNFDSDVAMTDATFGKVFNSDDTDLAAFRKHGGKLIQYHGWADPAIPPLDSIAYYNQVQHRMGPTSNFYRLFLAPGMLHCGGGPGPNSIATLPAITDWVEHGKAPALLVATKYEGNNPSKPVERTRPLCPFPTVAKWDGKGDKAKLESFRCVKG
jgi:Tannase and feruloyl esterase